MTHADSKPMAQRGGRSGRPANGSSWQVAQRHAGQRVDNFLLRECKGVPRPLVYRLLRTGKVRLNGARARPDGKLAAGDLLSMPAVRRAVRPPARPEAARLPQVAYEDTHYLVFDKPAGLAVHGGSGISFGLIEAARHMRSEEQLELAHRLDKETSGLVVVAKTTPGLRSFHAQLVAGQVDKRYLAAVVGLWSRKLATMDAPLRKIAAQRGGRRAVVDADGQPSLTRATCLRECSSGALLQLRLVTGRTHQARAHLAHAGAPVLGDDRYGRWEVNRQARAAGLSRMFLHAHKLAFAGKDGKLIALHSELPAMFTQALTWLDRQTDGSQQGEC